MNNCVNVGGYNMQKTKYYRLIESEEKGKKLNIYEVLQYRDLIFLLVKRNFVSQYKQTVLGPAWAIVQPLLTTVVFTFIFGNVAKLADCGAVPTFLFYMCGNIAWNFFAGCISGTANTFIANSGTMGKVYFPRLCVPIATVISQFISFAIQAVMFMGFLIIYLFIPGYSIGINFWCFVAPITIIQMAALGFGVGTIISAATAKYRDLQFLVGFGVQLWMYGTPVAYSMKIFGEGSILYTICRFNPMTPTIELLRYGFLGSEAGTVDFMSLIFGWVITIIVVFIGITQFNKVERTFMDTV